jgi:hypothetical protein
MTGLSVGPTSMPEPTDSVDAFPIEATAPLPQWTGS